MTTMIELDSLGMFKDPPDLLSQKPMTQEQEEALTALAKRMRAFTAKMPPLIVLLPRAPVDPVDCMFTFSTLSKENQRLVIQRSKQRHPSHFKSIPVFGKEIKDVQ